MNQKIKTIPLIGYCNRLSVRPGEVISFKVSSESKSNFNASLFRSFSSDPNPCGQGINEEKADQFFSPKSFKSRKHLPFFVNVILYKKSTIIIVIKITK